VNYEGGLSNVFAYYTNDTADWSAKSYKWIKTEVQLSNSNKTISVKLPEGAVYYFVNCIDDDGLMYSTPMVKVREK
jgi:hypothetical protein